MSHILSDIRGGGGTDFRPVFAEMEEGAPEVLILLAGGYGPAPIAEPDHPVLWALTNTGARPIDWGTPMKADVER